VGQTILWLAAALICACVWCVWGDGACGSCGRARSGLLAGDVGEAAI